MYKKNKILFFSSNIWKLVYLINTNELNTKSEKKIKSRNSMIPITLIKNKIKIYSGKSWIKKKINKWMIGYKFGEFTWNRKMALYKAKQLKSKKKKK